MTGIDVIFDCSKDDFLDNSIQLLKPNGYFLKTDRKGTKGSSSRLTRCKSGIFLHYIGKIEA